MKNQFLSKACCWVSVMMLSSFFGIYAQDAGTEDGCHLKLSAFRPSSIDLGDPVIFGEEFEVPELHLRFVHQKTEEPLIPMVVNVSYGWNWWEYPSTWQEGEEPWGAWSSAADLMKCSTGGDDRLVVPARTVEPRGWYDGKYTRFPYTLFGSKKPKFSGVVITVEFDNCRPRTVVKANDLNRYKNAMAVLKVPCATWPPVEVEFEKRAK